MGRHADALVRRVTPRAERGLQRVVITGMGVATPLGCSVGTFWDRLTSGESGVRSLDHLDLTLSRTRFGAPVDDAEMAPHLTAMDRQRLSRAAQLGIVAAAEAIGMADWRAAADAPDRSGVILGSSGGGFAAAEPFFFDVFQGLSANPLAVPVLMTNGPAANLSIRHAVRGPLVTMDTACAASAHAVGYAFQMIRSGTIDSVLTGGADTALSRSFFAFWSALRALSERNDCPSTACRPFSRDRDGLVLGEGAAILVVESAASARERGADILAEIVGFGMAGDGHHVTQPTVDGPARAMSAALVDAGLMPTDIDFISAHGTGTPWNDKIETAAIRQVFGDHAYHLPVVSIKGAVGHLIGASGGLGLVTCVRAILDGVIPPTINHTTPDPECDLDYVVEGKRTRPIRYAMTNAFAFGGANVSLVVGAYVA